MGKQRPQDSAGFVETIGQGLLGKKVGEKAEIKVPRGTLRFEVLEITIPGA